MVHVKVFFVDFHEVGNVVVPDTTASPYGALCGLLGYGSTPLHLMWSDEGNNLLPILSDRTFVEAVRSRRDPRQPLRLFVKGNALGPPRDPTWNVMMERTGRRGSFGNASGPPRRNSFGNSGFRKLAVVVGQRDRTKSPQEEPWRMGPVDDYVMRINKAPMAGTGKVAKGFNSSLLPQDPSLSELVDNVRINLEAAMKSVELCATRTSKAPQVVVTRRHGSLVKAACISPVTDKKAPQVEEHDQAQQVEETHKENVCTEIPELCTQLQSTYSSQDDFVLAPVSEPFCVDFDEQDCEIAESDFGSDETFEIVDPPEDCDSDIDWHEVEAIE